MTDNKSHPVKVPSGGFINELALRIKLIFKLLGDRRVSPLLKVIPLLTLVYLVIPDLVIGPFEQATAILERHRHTLDHCARELLRRETLDEAALRELTQDLRAVPAAVGTTAVRTLEFASDERGRVAAGSGICELFIYPGFRFMAVDAMITNFHLPQSTLLMLVSAFAGRENILNAYREAVRERYRFFSYGDAMFIG